MRARHDLMDGDGDGVERYGFGRMAADLLRPLPPMHPPADALAMPRVVQGRHGAAGDGWAWHGHIVTRAWPAAFTEAEYLLLQAGGTRRRLRTALAAVAPGGRPTFHHSSAMLRQVARDLDRECVDRYETQNVGCNAGRTILLDLLIASTTTSLIGVQYLAVGTGANVNPSTSDTQLVNEVFRKSITSTSITGGQALLACLFLSSEGNFTYTEAGLFGNGATGTANSGTLFAHALYSYNKQNTISLTTDYYVSLT